MVPVMRINEIFTALAHPARRKILQLLRAGELSAGELAEHCDMSKPSVSHHFSVLKEAGLIASRREGQNIFYSLNTTPVEDLLTVLMGVFPGFSDNGEERS
jgi:DNA-binding transcriptional ArsR family regulator